MVTNLETIKKTIKEFFAKMAFEVEIEISPSQISPFTLNTKERIPLLAINLKTQEPQILIGEGGQTLTEIQHLLRIILRKKIKEVFYLDLDINNYKKKKIDYLKELANSVADEVALRKREKQLPPMPAHERRIIHLELAQRQDVITESIGQEPKRKVVIKPYP